LCLFMFYFILIYFVFFLIPYFWIWFSLKQYWNILNRLLWNLSYRTSFLT
jgi:hypothetical protein